MTLKQIKLEYEALKKLAKADHKSQAVADKIADIARKSVAYLTSLGAVVPLKSRVSCKTYYAFPSKIKGKKLSRAVNEALYDEASLANLSYLTSGRLADLDKQSRAKLLYTVAASFLCTIDVLSAGDQKTPATYFEVLIGHLISRQLGVNPALQISIPGTKSTLPTDFIFVVGNTSKFHVPVKTSTRERAIQIFAHQRVLDGMYGANSYKGLLVGFAETKLGQAKREVIEICLPDQLRVYQGYIAPIERFYYFDVPDKYGALRQARPPLNVRSFAEFFDELDALL